ELTITSNLTDQEVEPTFMLTFTLSRLLPATEGRLAILIGQTDISSLVTPTGNNLSYLPRILPLPPGASTIKIFLVSPSNEWRDFRNWGVGEKPWPAPTAAREKPGGEPHPSPADPAQTAAAKKYGFTPSLTIGMKSQMAEGHFPESSRP